MDSGGGPYTLPNTNNNSHVEPKQPRYRNRKKKKKGSPGQQGHSPSKYSPKKPSSASTSPGGLESRKQLNKARKLRVRQKISQVRRENVPIRPIEKVCTAFMKGKCHVPDCRFVHLIKPKRIESCKYWITDRCLHGAKCTFSHSTPCKYFHLYNYCQLGESCKFSHQRPLTDLAMKAFMNEQKLQVPPKVIQHDWTTTTEPSPLVRYQKIPAPKPIEAVFSSPSSTPVTKVAETSIHKDDDEEDVEKRPELTLKADEPSFSLSGFYKETLPESNGENGDSNSLQVVAESELSSAQNDIEETTSNDGLAVENHPENGDVISGKVEDGINYSVRVISDRSYPNYSDLRESLLPACTVVDPRLRYGPRPVRPEFVVQPPSSTDL